jgi:high affinity Mn2+ porin
MQSLSWIYFPWLVGFLFLLLKTFSMALTNKRRLILLVTIVIAKALAGQTVSDSEKNSKWTNHFQLTVIAQKHSGFASPYSGEKSLADTVEPTATSLSTTLFLGRKLWKGASFFFNPEASGGKGLSFATGVAGALNGETYRVGEVAPEVFVARAYLQQHIPLANTAYEYIDDDVNQIAGKIPTSRITVSAGKFAVADFFDDNSYSKDPRTQFFNWSAWANGAWDYPANTRGYTYGIVVELIKPKWAIKISSVAVPRIANFHLMEYKFGKVHSETIEFEHKFSVSKRQGNFHFFVSNTRSQAPSYENGINAIATNNQFLLDVIKGEVEHRTYGGKKFGLGINIEQELTDQIGFFTRAGWNDGKYATWAFTEIDRSINAGISVKGKKWKRNSDSWAVIGIINGLSQDHRAFLKAGGYGFIIGDGNLNYGTEQIIETYYSAQLNKFLWLTFDYQFVNNPGYNKDRGPVHVFGLRGHVEF